MLAVFLELSMSFDQLHRQTLLQKPNHPGVQAVALNLVESQLWDRHQYDEMDEEHSSVCQVKAGMAQENVLGLSFILFLNDIVNLDININYIIHTDHTSSFLGLRVDKNS